MTTTGHTSTRAGRRPGHEGGIFADWVLLVTIGEFLGFLAPALVGTLAAGTSPYRFLFAMVAAGLVEGAVLGTAQSVVLHRRWPALRRRDWIAATTSAAGFAWLIGMLPSTFDQVWLDWPTALTVAVAAVLGCLMLFSFGFLQWRVLRHHLARAWRWIPAVAIGWAIGLTVLLAVVLPLWQPGQSGIVVAAIGAIGGLVMAASMALLTGWMLNWMIRHEPH
ncbi:hypothetical protein GCM10009841_14580 [Microlunatus panaciterrae]|uniref:MFS family permease n=1 Tax=Microlunatus panaciterrae TaxID=400768 RepID=A0ABS2RMS3_9ACTN|nr:hypothetical protein [Microlunatus panaciterrae]MBM7800018.1 MFS family permease [Microlunatus panaciterrae]